VSLPIWAEKAQRWSCSVCRVNVQSKYWRQRWLVMLVEELCRPTDAPWTWCFVERHVVKAAAFIPSRLSPLAARLRIKCEKKTLGPEWAHTPDRQGLMRPEKN
jgi:hypothetical protein